jgi:hypothetical protein
MTIPKKTAMIDMCVKYTAAPNAERRVVPLPAKIGETLHAPVIAVEGGEVPGP